MCIRDSLIAGVPAYTFYISHRADSWMVVSANTALRLLHKILWNRWYIDKFYMMIFVRGFHRSRPMVQSYVENGMDTSLNRGVPRLFAVACNRLRRIQTGVASINVLYILIFITSIAVIVLLVS